MENDRVQIRRMAVGDLPQVLAIENATFPTPWSRESFMQELTRNVAARYLVAEVDGKIAAYAGAWIVIDEAQITNIAVKKEMRGKGIGRKITSQLMQYLSNLGASFVTLEVRKSNLTARNLYKSLGFVDVGIRKRYYEDNGEDAYLMVCEKLPDADPDFTEEETVFE